jgi:3-hydroxybutyryl-CoA dehydrogenase
VVARIGVAGAGTMGAGIAQISCMGGFRTLLHDPDAGALARGDENLRATLVKGVDKGWWSREDAEAASSRLMAAGQLQDLAECDLVIEAAPENLDVKRRLFAELEEICKRGAILATNTSSLSVTAIAAEGSNPERVCGMHFFNPPTRMRLVEVIAGDATGAETIDTCLEVARKMGREPVRAKDSVGFIANRCVRPFNLEALRMLGEGVAAHDEIDWVIREDGGYRMGPFELMDLIGIDVNLSVARSFYSQRPEPRWEPHPIQEQMVAEGRLGRKSGRGFYDYGEGAVREPGSPPADDVRRAILDRVVCQLVNEASFAAEEGVGTREDIDTAMKLGFNHPRGPFDWLAELGAARVVGVLDELAERLNPERYRVAPPLRAAA